MSECLRVEGIGKEFMTESKNKIEVLKDVSFTLNFGQCMVIVGQSGSGKSTLLQVLGAIMTPSSGKVFFKGQDIFALNEKKRNLFRGVHLGFVFQFHHLLPDFTAFENVMFPLLVSQKNPIEESQEKVKLALEQVGLAHRMHHYPYALSGGEQQRVAIARAMISSPDLILADEPTGNLDPKNAEEVSSLLIGLTREKNIGLIMATHNMLIADKADQVCRIVNGQLEQVA